MRRWQVLPLGQLLAAGLIVGIAAIGVVPSSNAARDVSPGTFSRVSSGVALIRTYGCGGKSLGQGTGFLVGSSVVMTARHVIVGACRARIRVGGETFFAKRAVSWYGGGASPSAADVATLKLDHASDGFVFRVRSSRVPLGTNLGMVGYPLGNRLSLNQGKLIWRGRENRAPLLAVRMLGAEGASGSPFIDDEGRVVGILQVGLGSEDVLGQRTAGVLMGLDLVRWWGPRARLDLCRAYPNGGIAGCPGSRPVPPPPPTTESVKVIAANVSATEEGPAQTSFVSAPSVTLFLRVDFAAPTKRRHGGNDYAIGPSGERVDGCGGDIDVGWEGFVCKYELNYPAPGSWRIVYLIDGRQRAVGFEITSPAPPPPPPPPPPAVETVPVQDYFMSSSEACSDRVQTYAVSVPRAHLCVFVGPFVQNHPVRIEWVSPSGAVFPVSGTITPGYQYWNFWVDFATNMQTGVWTVRFYFDNTLYGQVSFQRI